MARTAKTKPEPPVQEQEARNGGIQINSKRDTKIKGDVVGGNKTTYNDAPQDPRKAPREAAEHVSSSWANGMFYLFAFVVIVALLAWLAQRTEALTLTVIAVVGLLAVPLIGALQLRMDNRLTGKSMVELIKIVLAQLPVIGNLMK